jgi:hypothetical protein
VLTEGRGAGPTLRSKFAHSVRADGRLAAPASRRFLATPDRDPSVCPRSGSRSAHAAGDARSLEIPIGPFRWVDRPLTPSLRLASQTPFCAENLEPASLEPAAPRGWLNFWRTNISRRRGLASGASSSDVIQGAWAQTALADERHSLRAGTDTATRMAAMSRTRTIQPPTRYTWMLPIGSGEFGRERRRASSG